MMETLSDHNGNQFEVECRTYYGAHYVEISPSDEYRSTISLDKVKAREWAAILLHFADTGDLPEDGGE